MPALALMTVFLAIRIYSVGWELKETLVKQAEANVVTTQQLADRITWVQRTIVQIWYGVTLS